MKHFWQGVATLTGVSIGAGILAMPYALNKTGFFIGSIEIIIVGLAMMLLSLYLGEIILRTKGEHQLYGLAEKYLGKYGKIVMFIAFVVGAYGTIAAYIVGEAEAISITLGTSKIFAGILYLIILSVILWVGIRLLEKSEVLLNLIKIFLFASIFYFVASNSFDYSNLTKIEPSNIFLPIGTLLFAFMCFSVIPELKQELRGNFKDIKKVIITSSIITIIGYILFNFIVIGSTGEGTSELATIALSLGKDKSAFLLINLFAIITIFTASIAISYALKQMFMEDLKINNFESWLLTLVPSIALALVFHNFATLIALTGALAGGIMGVLIILMYQNAKHLCTRKPEYTMKENKLLELFLIILFIVAVFTEILSII